MSEYVIGPFKNQSNPATLSASDSDADSYRDLLVGLVFANTYIISYYFQLLNSKLFLVIIIKIVTKLFLMEEKKKKVRSDSY